MNMNRLNFAGACLLAFGGFQETSALSLQSKLATTNPKSDVFTQRWYPEPNADLAQIANPVPFETWNHPVRVTFDNGSSDQVELFWHDYNGDLVSYGNLAKGQTKQMYTYASQPWSAAGTGDYSVNGRDVFVPVARDSDRVFTIAKRSSNYNLVTDRNCSGNELIMNVADC